MREGHIYTITNNINGKVYVGQTRQRPARRWIQHREAAYFAECYDLPLYRALRKYGSDNFSFCVIEDIIANTEQDLTHALNIREKWYISKFNAHGDSGYNLTDGGTDWQKGRGKPVYRVSSDGTIAQRYNSISEAAYDNTIPYKNINDACNRRSHYTHGTFWYYEDQLDNPYIGQNIGAQFCGRKTRDYSMCANRNIPVAAYSIDGMLIGKYSSIEDASAKSPISECSIRRILKGEKKYIKGVTFVKIDKEE